jgi:hypothetical protein
MNRERIERRDNREKYVINKSFIKHSIFYWWCAQTFLSRDYGWEKKYCFWYLYEDYCLYTEN